MLSNNNQHQHSHKESRRESRDISGIVIKLPLESSCRNKFLHHGWLVENGRSDKKQTLVNTCTIKIRKKPSSTHIGRKSESVLVIWDSLIKFKHQHEKCDMEVSSLQNTQNSWKSTYFYWNDIPLHCQLLELSAFSQFSTPESLSDIAQLSIL